MFTCVHFSPSSLSLNGNFLNIPTPTHNTVLAVRLQCTSPQFAQFCTCFCLSTHYIFTGNGLTMWTIKMGFYTGNDLVPQVCLQWLWMLICLSLHHLLQHPAQLLQPNILITFLTSMVQALLKWN
jgi:hypothetical protein